jgi:hypothetical protein
MHMQTDAFDPTIDTIVPIGVMGSGKSSLANILTLRDHERKIPGNKEQQNFPISAGERAGTEEIRPYLGPGTQITSGNKIRVIDSPGLD